MIHPLVDKVGGPLEQIWPVALTDTSSDSLALTEEISYLPGSMGKESVLVLCTLLHSSARSFTSTLAATDAWLSPFTDKSYYYCSFKNSFNTLI